MSIFNRLSRLGRAEVSDLKRQLREANSTFEDFSEESRYHSDIVSAEAELARHLDGDPVGRQWEAQLYGQAPAQQVTSDSDMDRGASLWGAPPAQPAPSQASTATTSHSQGAPLQPGWVQTGESNPWAAPSPQPTPTRAPVTPASSRQEPFPREIREAYAVLELPLGSDRTRIDESFRNLIGRYHPDRFQDQPERLKAAQELSQRLTEARTLLFNWLEGRL